VLSKGLNSNAGILERNDNHEGLVAAGEWSILRLYLRGQRNGTVCKQVPKLCAVMDEVVKETPLCRLGQVKFSMLPPGTKVLPHCGPSNMRLRLHLGLKVKSRASSAAKGTAAGLAVSAGLWKFYFCLSLKFTSSVIITLV